MPEAGAGSSLTSTSCVPDPSAALPDAEAKDTLGSLSAMVSVCVSVPIHRCERPTSVSTTVSSPSGALSSTMATGMFAVVEPAFTVTVPEPAIVKSEPPVAVPPTV